MSTYWQADMSTHRQADMWSSCLVDTPTSVRLSARKNKRTLKHMLVLPAKGWPSPRQASVISHHKRRGVRRTQRYTSRVADDEAALTANIVFLASEYGRYSYRRITALLRADGWRVNHPDTQSRPGVPLEVGGRDIVHRAGESVGERLHRKLQRQTQGRTPQRGDLHNAKGGKGVDGGLASGHTIRSAHTAHSAIHHRPEVQARNP